MNAESQHNEQRCSIFADWKTIVDQAFQQATHDSLTGLPNRSLFHDQVRMALSESKRHNEILGILFIDLDNFKKVNDLRGHPVGDQLLASVGSCLSKVMRSEEMVARLGGDEFAVLIRRLKSPQEAEIVAARLLKALEPQVTASIGISLYPFDGEDEEILLRHADAAMFRVKKRGGHGLEFFQSPPKKNKEVISLRAVNSNKPKKNILIVDNDADFQLVMQKRLKQEGYVCASVDSAEEALERVCLSTPDLVILDLGLRQASGLVFLQKFSKAVPNGKKIPPVLVVSGHNEPQIVDFTTMLGASRFISKPLGSSTIVLAIRSLI